MIARILGIEIARQFGRALDVGEQCGDTLALTIDSRLRGLLTSDFVGRVLGMSLQDAAARRKRGQRALRDAVGPDGGHEFVDDGVPCAPRHQGVRSVICNNLNVVLSQRHEA